MYSDINALNTILRNLMSNAIKFTREGGSIAIDARRNGKVVKISIQDTGIGMSKEKMDNLFDTTGHNSTPGTQNEKGSGLGLSLVKDLCDMINAEIEVESKLDLGTKFTVFLKEDKKN